MPVDSSSAMHVVPLVAVLPAEHVAVPFSSSAVASTDGSASGTDLFENLTPVGSLAARLGRRTLWSEAASTVFRMVTDSVLGGAIGWLVNYVFHFGNFLSGQAPEHQSYASFCAGIMGTTSSMLGLSMLVAQASSMLRLHFKNAPDRHPRLGSCVQRLARRTALVYVISLALVVTSAYLVSSLPSSTHFLKLHFYVSGLFVNLYTVSLDLAYRRTFELETVEGEQRGRVYSGSYWKLLVRLTIKDFLLFASVYVAAAYIHISTALELQTSRAIFVFSVVSYAFKLVTQEVTKAVMLHQKKTHAKTIYLAVAVPTVLIDTQIRAMLLREPNVSQSLAGSIAVGVVEVVFRFLKVWLIRLEIWVHEKNTLRRIASVLASGAAGPVVAVRKSHWWSRGSVSVDLPNVQDDPLYTEFLRWRWRLLRFHAAEIHADMYAEYLAIACSMSIYFFFHAHPKYAWSRDSSSSLSPQRQAAYLGAQVALEMTVDAMSCLWELANGVPIHSSRRCGFVSALFACCSVANIVLSAAMYVKHNHDEVV